MTSNTPQSDTILSDQPETAEAPTVLDISEIRIKVRLSLERSRDALRSLRKRRDELNEQIRAKVAEVTELERVDRSLNPKKAAPKPKAGS